MIGYVHGRWGRTGIFLALLVAMLPACTSSKTKQDYRMAALQGDLYRMAKSNKATQTAIQDTVSRLKALETTVAGLQSPPQGLTGMGEEDLLQEITGETTAHTLKDLSNWVHALDSRVRGLQTTVDKLAGGPGPPVASPKVAPGVPKKSAPEKGTLVTEGNVQPTVAADSAEAEYKKAYEAYMKRRHAEALSLFKDFLKRYPDHQLADNAQYWIGETHYDMGDYASAILTFKDVVARYTDHAKAPDALLKIGYAYIALDDVSNARMFLKRVINNYPLSTAESKARAKLKELDRQGP
ncbi:MAG: tol-pal system protein YbgF [Thermodesulfobacteriota bacterium]|nr:tol-pal system protein YbgF [Thermodesulfobacteriota bacterium]